MTRLLAAVVAFIVYGSLYPWRFDFGQNHPNAFLFLLHSRIPAFDRYAVRDAVLNVTLYIPFGAAAVLAIARRCSRAAAFGLALPAGLALTAAMEMLQVYVPGREPSMADVLSNFAGTALGAGGALVFGRAIEQVVERGRLGSRSAPAALLLACWAGYQFYPLIPRIGLYSLSAGVRAMIAGGVTSPLEVWSGAAEWFAAAAIFGAVARRPGPALAAAAMLCLPARLLIAGRALSLDEVLGAVLALGLWSVFRKAPALAAACILGSAIVLRELAPFHFAAQPAAFSWTPFAASFEAPREAAVIVLFRKAFEYGAEVWLLHAAGWRYAAAGAGVAAVLAVLEAVQRYLPGRSPEITDPVLALLIAFALWKLGARGSRPPTA